MRTINVVSKSVAVAARKRLLTMHFESGVGHIGGNLSALDALLVVWHEFITGQGRFILSKGHAAGALYVALWSAGRLTDLDLKTFHQDNTLLAGHPPTTGIADIPFATGSLGHGLSLAAGTALAMKLRGQSDRVFCMTSDGEWQEGSTWEALIFACHHKLTNLTVLVDHNGLQGFGTTASVASMSPLHEKLLGFDVKVTSVNGHDLSSIRDALSASPLKLHIIVLETIKGHGVRFMENRLEWHYLPLSPEQFHAAIEDVGRI
ncbi:MAG: 1-deoxy-D-xylulose-5-phosphate synthase N-terminal domain-containing protein [Betaproteobacteria bacterium]|jgi:transketolase